MKSIAVLLNLSHYFYHGIQRDKTRNFVHDEVFEVQYEIYRFRRKNTHNLLLQNPSKDL